MNKFSEKLKAFLHDPIDKCFDIPAHIERAKRYAEKLEVSEIEKSKGSDIIASSLERSLLPKGVKQDFTEIRHPLSTGSIKIENYPKKKIFQKIEKAYENIGEEVKHWNEEKKFFYLWRNLQDKLFEDLKSENWAKFLPILPADTRIPDHSIWEHLKITSAINAFWDEESKTAYQNNSLFLFTIGPVQSFIKQARKTQDFYMGSFMLSYFTFVAIKKLIDKYGPTSVIYPDLYKQSFVDWFLKEDLKIDVLNFKEENLLLPTIPNKFVAIIPTSKKEEIESFANELKNSIKEEIKKVKKTIVDELNLNEEQELKKGLEEHLAEFPQIYWVALSWKVQGENINLKDLKDFLEGDLIEAFECLWDFAEKNGKFPPNIGLIYEPLYFVLEKSMGIRKNLREFKQTSEIGRKCSVCGERNVLFFREKNNPNKFLRNEPKPLNLINKVSLKTIADGEGLCGLCFMKRFFEKYLEKEISSVFKDLSFPSTSEIACANFKAKALEKAQEEFKEYENKFKIFHESSLWTFPVPKLRGKIEKTLEGHWFYEENLRIKEFKRALEISEENILEEEINKLKKALKKLTDKVGFPSSYYAVIKLDGDSMGKWLSGDLLPEIEFAYNSQVWEKLPEEFKEKLKKCFKPLNLEKKDSRKILTPAIHASISAALRNYALEFVPKIVEEEHFGKLVYAGGDDVLAFVNLEDLWNVMHKLRAAFSGHAVFEKSNNGKTNIKVDWSNSTGFVLKDGKYLLTMGPQAGASMGIVIAHYKAPLQIVLGKVSAALEIAKNLKYEDKEKDAFCLVLMRRSGEERITKLKWKYNKNFDTMEKLKEISEKFNEKNEEGYFSSRFIYQLQEEFVRLKKNEKLIVTPDAFECELYRILLRAYNGPKKGEEKKSFSKDFCSLLMEIYEKMEENFENFINFLLIVSFVRNEISKEEK